MTEKEDKCPTHTNTVPILDALNRDICRVLETLTRKEGEFKKMDVRKMAFWRGCCSALVRGSKCSHWSKTEGHPKWRRIQYVQLSEYWGDGRTAEQY